MLTTGTNTKVILSVTQTANPYKFMVSNDLDTGRDCSIEMVIKELDMLKRKLINLLGEQKYSEFNG